MSTRYARSALKSVIERTLAAVLLLVGLAPVMAACAIAVALRDGWPVIYVSTRVGRSGRRFGLLKFRTMRLETGRAITAGGDPRITPLGSVLRRWKLDELPQLWNVIRGDMSLIGPRPESPEFVDETSAVWAEILEVPPGITGAASVAYFNEEETLRGASDPIALYRNRILPEKLAIERRYLNSCSPGGDARLLIHTLRRIFGSGGRQVE